MDPCLTETCWPVFWIPELPTATGWETDDNAIKPADLAPPEQPVVVITTRTQKIVNIQTNTISTVTKRPPIVNGSGNVNNEPSQDPTGAAAAQGPGNAPDDLVPAAQQTIGNALLSDIVSRMGEAPSRTQPVDAITALVNGVEETNVPVQQQITQAASTTGGANAPGLEETLSAGGLITMGSATLTLTPGLSTTIGSDADAMFIAIATDSARQIIITISSSGTAVTATIVEASATVTLPKTGFEASITDVARPGTLATTAVVGASSSSRGSAQGKRQELGWWTGALLAVMGSGALV